MRHEMEVYYQFLANAASVCFGRIVIIATSYVRARGSTMFFFHLFSVLEFFVVNLQMYPRWLFLRSCALVQIESLQLFHLL